MSTPTLLLPRQSVLWTLFVPFVLLLALTAMPPAHADGKVFATTRAVLTRVDIPDQQALIHYSNGVERLVIQTAFTGSGTNFAWVVPLPAPPEIEPVPEGVFTTLEYIFQPHLIRHVYPYWAWPLGVALLIAFLRLVPRAVFWLCVITLLAALFLPALGPAHSKAGGSPTTLNAPTSVQILQRQQVGIYDTTTLRATDARHLVDWLTTNGFTLPTNALPVVRDYVRDGWVFAAMRVHRTNDVVDPHRIHPLAFTFPSTNAVYPLRLTGIDNGPCRIDLYVFGPGRASAPGFKVHTCDWPLAPTAHPWRAFNRDRGLVLADHVSRWSGLGPVATRLTGVLNPQDMLRDAVVQWSPLLRPTRPRLYTTAATLHYSLNLAVPLWLVLAGVAVLQRQRNLPIPRWLRPGVLAILALGLATFAALPRTSPGQVREYTVRGGIFNSAKILSLNLYIALRDIWETTPLESPANPRSAAAIEDQIRFLLADPAQARETFYHVPKYNLLTGGPLRVEASPGNFSVRPATAGFELVWHDAYGNPGVVTRLTFP